jgi:hypothetical protein
VVLAVIVEAAVAFIVIVDVVVVAVDVMLVVLEAVK